MAKKWKVADSGLYFEERVIGVVLVYPPDDTAIMIAEDEIADIIEALKRIKSHFRVSVLKQIEASRLACWGKQRTPTVEDEFTVMTSCEKHE